jgi:hypothetical protein
MRLSSLALVRPTGVVLEDALNVEGLDGRTRLDTEYSRRDDGRLVTKYIITI